MMNRRKVIPMKKRRKSSKYSNRKRVMPVRIEVTSNEIDCPTCNDTGICDHIDDLGYHSQLFCQCPAGIKLSRSYEHNKCPLCQNSCFATVWKDSSTKPGRKEYRRVRCPHFKKP